MPHDRPEITAALARRLVDSQFPQWSRRPLHRLEPAGSDHVIYRLGPELSVRLPRHPGAVGQAEKEQFWLPRLAPHLPLAVPVPVAVGRPAHGYPWPWAVQRWLAGEVATAEVLGDAPETPADLAGFLTALQQAPTGPTPPAAGLVLAERDQATRAAIAEVTGVFDAGAMTAVWAAALSAPPWDQAPVWCHGDFHTGNLLTAGGRLSAVIDFGGLAVGDPAADLMVAYTLLSAANRAAFRGTLGLDDATWARGRGYALATGLNAYTSYAATNPGVARQTTRQITAAIHG